jgi:putative ABC transport system substrate-binding protein
MPHWVGFEQRLRDLGFVEGQNLAVDFRSVEGKIERLPAAMAELVRRKVDVIVAGGTEVTVRAAMQATDTIPIVMVAIDFDPLSHGYVPSLARPGAAAVLGLCREWITLRQVQELEPDIDPAVTGDARDELTTDVLRDIRRAWIDADL